MKTTLLLLLTAASSVFAQDVVFMTSGEKRPGRVVGTDGTLLRLEVPLPTAPGAVASAAPMFASVSLPKADVARIEFAADPVLEALLKDLPVAKVPDLEARWPKLLPWLSMPRSPAGRAGNVLGDGLLRTDDPAQAAKALELFTLIEAEAWDETDRMLARQGRLRAMVATGRAKEAVAEAVELAAVTENPAVLIEAKYILAEADAAALRKLVEENPRWEEDVFVKPERERLYHAALDLYLYPSLFYGSETGPAARGLWGAVKLYEGANAPAAALECARDIVALYPGTKYAALARDWIASQPEEIRAIDPEKEAREENATPSKPAAEPSPEPKNKKSPDKKPK